VLRIQRAEYGVPVVRASAVRPDEARRQSDTAERPGPPRSGRRLRQSAATRARRGPIQRVQLSTSGRRRQGQCPLPHSKPATGMVIRLITMATAELSRQRAPQNSGYFLRLA